MADTIHYCSTCSKPFTSITPHRRHQAYCRRAQTRPKKRPRSCLACSAAKVKCSFETSCSRCVHKGLKCVYEKPIPGSNAEPLLYTSALNSEPSLQTSPPDTSKPYALDVSLFSDSAVALSNRSSGLDRIQEDVYGGINFTAQDDASWQFSNSNEVDDFLLNNELSMSDLLHSPEQHIDSLHYLVKISPEKPIVRHNANLILEAICAIPEQMLRRNTLPPFIHPHWHLLDMPEPLAVCMELAQLFSRRTPATSEFLWRTILAESRRVIEQIPLLSNEDLLAATQAGMVYVIMRVVDGPMQSPEWNQEMTFYQNVLCNAFLEKHDGNFCESEAENPSTNWQDWIFAESRRRTSCVWFLIARTIMVKTESGCPTTEAPWTLPLPSPKTQWEARTIEDWILEIEAGTSPICDFGSLIEARQKWNEPVHARKLDSWSARTDTLGSLLNIAVSMV